MKAIIQHNTYHIKSVDEATCQMFGCSKDWLIGRSLLDLIPNPELRALAKWRLDHIRSKGDLHEQPLPLARPDGSAFWGKITTKRAGENVWESVIIYDGEI